jgi:hypothetical protein
MHVMAKAICICKISKQADELNLGIFLVVLGHNLLLLGVFQYTDNFLTITFILMLGTCLGCGHILPLLFQGGCADLEKTFTTESVYGDFRRPMSKVVLTLIGQVMFFMLFWQSSHAMLEEGKRVKSFNYVYWLSSFFTMQMLIFSGDYKLKGILGVWYPMRAAGWETLFRSRNASLLTDESDDHWVVTQLTPLPRLPALLLHWFGSFVCDGVMIGMLNYVVPVILAQSRDAEQYIFTVFSLTFVCMIDDISAVTFTLVPSHSLIHQHPILPRSKDGNAVMLKNNRWRGHSDDAGWIFLERHDDSGAYREVPEDSARTLSKDQVAGSYREVP